MNSTGLLLLLRPGSYNFACVDRALLSSQLSEVLGVVMSYNWPWARIFSISPSQNLKVLGQTGRVLLPPNKEDNSFPNRGGRLAF